MAALADGSLTRIGFRRDVKLFLAALVGYLIVVILALLLILQQSVITTSEMAGASWDAVSRMVAADLDRIETFDPAAIERRLTVFRQNAEFLSAELVPTGGVPVRSGLAGQDGREVRSLTRHGELRIVFDDSLVRHEREKFAWIAGIVILGSLAVTILLVQYLPRIVRPIEEMLAHAREVEVKAAGVDEARYLVETFRRTIDTLKEQKEEISRLHDVERTRAADLERVSSTLKRSINSGFFAVDDQGRIVDVNRLAEDMLGVRDAPGRQLEDALGDSPFATDLRGCLTDRKAISRHETSHPGPDGDVAIGLTTVPLHSEDDRFIGMIAIFADLTPIRSLEVRVRELQTLADLGEISAGIAHEFRNSLATVLGYLRLARREDEPGERRARLEAAEHEAKLLSEAVGRLLAFSRPIAPQLATVDLAAIAAETVARLERDMPDGAALSIQRGTAVVRGDASLLRVVVENLVRNALDAVREVDGEKRVGVRVGTEGASGVLEVIDNGPGIDPADIPRVFLPFQSGKPGGFGLGLALSRKIVLLHDGQLTLEPRERGIVARLEIPAV
jgi:PAS domain S-box-containing protein